MINLFRKKPIIEFYCHPDLEKVIPEPKPAYKYMAKWFKECPVHLPELDRWGAKTFTAKKCMPLLDAMSYGYVLHTCGDMTVKTNSDLTETELFVNPYGIQIAEFHNVKQVGEFTAPGFPAAPIKFVNHWVIKTAPGWSTLFMPLLNDFEEKRFTALSGLVDTDHYPKEVNIPVIWHIPDFEDVIEAGTPLCVVIPIKRDAAPRKVPIRDMKPAERRRIEQIQLAQNSKRKHYAEDLREPRK